MNLAVDTRTDSKNWRATLDLSFESSPDKTILRRSHLGPLMVQRPFYPEGPVCHAYVLHPPGGVVGGDSLSVMCKASNGASGLVTAPGANKFYGSDGRLAQFHQRIVVGDAALEWMPQESIFFDQCQVLQSLRIDLTAVSRFIGWDISCFGRPAGNFQFSSGRVTTQLDVYVDNKPLLLERLRVNGETDLARISGLRGSSTNATMLAIAPNLGNNELLEQLRNDLHKQFSITLIENMFVIRYLGNSTEVARLGFIALWKKLRPIIMQRSVVEPRIWAT